MQSDNADVWVTLPVDYLSNQGIAAEIDLWMPSGQKGARFGVPTPHPTQIDTPYLHIISDAPGGWSALANTIYFGELDPTIAPVGLGNTATTMTTPNQWVTLRVEVDILQRTAQFFYDGTLLGDESLTADALMTDGMVNFGANTSCCSVPTDVCWSNLRIYTAS